jgi:hypothetical protein
MAAGHKRSSLLWPKRERQREEKVLFSIDNCSIPPTKPDTIFANVSGMLMEVR